MSAGTILPTNTCSTTETSPLRQQLLIPDGGIVKVVISPPPSDSHHLKPINWTKGDTAQVHYSVFTAPFRPVGPNRHMPCCSSPSHDSHDGSHHHSPHDVGSHNDHIHPHPNFHLEAFPLIQPGNIIANQQQKISSMFVTPSGIQFLFDPNARKVLADTRRDDGPDNPFELRIGRKFTFSALEIAIKSMNIGETARFLITPEYTTGFIQLESHLRRLRGNATSPGTQNRPPISSCCIGFDSDKHADLYDTADLPLELEITLVRVQRPDQDFVPEAWELSGLDKCNRVPSLKEHGNLQFKRSEIGQAQVTYAKALSYLESLNYEIMTKHALGETLQHNNDTHNESEIPPNVTVVSKLDRKWLSDMILTLRLNLALCSLKLAEYDRCITQCSLVLGEHPHNVKARFRRALAHLRRGRDLELAQADLEAVASTKSQPHCINVNVKLSESSMNQLDPEWMAAWSELQSKQQRAKHKEQAMWRGMFDV